MTRIQEAATAFALGALAGSIAGLLLAPEKGTVTRKRIREFAGGVGDAAGGALKTATGTLRMRADAVRGAIAEGARVYRDELDRAHA